MGERLEKVVSDTGPIIHLNQIDSLYLFGIFDTILVPETVMDELSKVNIPSGLDEIEYQEISSNDERSFNLDSGETSAINVALENEVGLLTDDLEAREKAKEMGIETHGSIGVIAINQQKGKLSFQEAKELMRDLQDKSALFISDEIIERAIENLRGA